MISFRRLLLKLFAFGVLVTSSIRTTFGIDVSDFRNQAYKPDNLPGVGSQTGGTLETRLGDIIQFAINLLLYASGSVAVLIIVIGGIRYITSLGDEEAMKKAKSLIFQAVAGLLFVILAYALVTNVISLIYRATT